MKAIVNIGLKKGVLDSGGKATHHTLQTIGFGDLVADVRVGKQIIMELNTTVHLHIIYICCSPLNPLLKASI